MLVRNAQAAIRNAKQSGYVVLDSWEYRCTKDEGDETSEYVDYFWNEHGETVSVFASDISGS